MSEFLLFHSQTFFWAAALVVLLVIEGATTNLVTIWFAVGALAALLLSLFCESFLWQALVFAVVSILALLFTRPLLKRFRRNLPPVPLGLERNIGRKATVRTAIGPDRRGRVTLDGVDWQAVCDSPLEPGDICIVQKINSTTLEVIPAETTQTL